MAWSTSARHGTNWKPPGYKRLRTQRFAVYGDRCVDCGSTDRLELDHHNGDRNDWAPANLLPRCRTCHAQRTAMQAAAARPSARRPSEPHPGLIHTERG